MKWLVLVLAAVGLVGCGEASPASSALTEVDAGSDGGGSLPIPSYPLCEGLEPQAPYTTYKPCDPGFDSKGAHWTATTSGVESISGDGGTAALSTVAVEYALCGISVTAPCALPPQEKGSDKYPFTLHVFCVPYTGDAGGNYTCLFP